MNLSKLFSAFSGKLDKKIYIDGFASTPLPSYRISAFERFFWLCVLIGCFMGLSSLVKGQGEDLRRSYSVNVSNAATTQKVRNREDMTRKTLVPAKTFRCELKYQITKEGVYSPKNGTEVIFTPADNWLSLGSGESYMISSYEISKSHVNKKKGKILLSCSLGVFQFFKKNGAIYRMVFTSNDLKEKYILSNDLVPISWKEGDAE